MMVDSVRNCSRMALVLAPRDLRIPISRVRSVTDTSMMFITPIPPTIREMAATAAMKLVTRPMTSLIISSWELRSWE